MSHRGQQLDVMWYLLVKTECHQPFFNNGLSTEAFSRSKLWKQYWTAHLMMVKPSVSQSNNFIVL